MLGYLPKPLQQQVSVATIKGLMEQELRQLQGHSSQEAQISFIGGSGARVAGGDAGGGRPRREGLRVEGLRKLLHLACSSHLTWGPGPRAQWPQLLSPPSTPRGREAAAPLWLHCLRGTSSEPAGPARTQPPGAKPSAPRPHGAQLPGEPGTCPSVGLGTLGSLLSHHPH